MRKVISNKVLVVDDFRLYLNAMETAIEYINYKPYSALTAQEAREFIENTMFLAIFVDGSFDLDDYAGAKFCEEYRNRDDLYLVANSSDPDSNIMMMGRGARDVLAKSPKQDDLLSVLLRAKAWHIWLQEKEQENERD